jgi:hypothetical protein
MSWSFLAPYLITVAGLLVCVVAGMRRLTLLERRMNALEQAELTRRRVAEGPTGRVIPRVLPGQSIDPRRVLRWMDGRR